MALWYYSVALVIVCFARFEVLAWWETGIWFRNLREIRQPCEVVPASHEFRDMPIVRGLDWCVGSPKEPVNYLMFHMEKHTPATEEAVVAQNFGSNMRLLYLKRKAGFFQYEGLFMLNPEIAVTDTDVAMSLCGAINGEVARRPSSVSVKFLDREFKPKTQRFTDNDACRVQILLDKL